MAKRYFGIDIDGNTLRVVTAHEEKGKTVIAAASSRTLAEGENPAALLHELMGNGRRYGDRAALALPASEGYARWVEFPFADEKKIEAALPFELGNQIPISTEECLADSQKPAPLSKDRFRVAAAAVPRDILRATLEPFDRAGVPVHILDLSPFAQASGLAGRMDEGILACLGENETCLARVAGGEISGLRVIPGPLDAESALPLLRREISALERSSGGRDLPVTLIGSGANNDLAASLGRPASIPRVTLEGTPLEPAYLPAAALALRTAQGDKARSFNFRRDEFALRGEWAASRRRLIVTAALLSATLLVGATSAYLNYARRAQRAETLSQEMTRIYKETFPASKAIVDIPLQMRSGIEELRRKNLLLAAGESSPLALLQEISTRVPEDVVLDVRAYNFTPEAIRIEGSTSTFESINKLARSLEQATVFKQVQISDAKMSLEGDRVEFRINLTLTAEGEKR